MMQTIIKCTRTPCRKFFVNTAEERLKAMHNGWTLKAEYMTVCANHRYLIFGEPGESD